MTRSSKFPHLTALDGLRGLAALGVLFHHTFSAGLDPAAPQPWHLRILAFGSFYGYTGVTLFFVLSGYLITSLLLKDRNRPAYFRDFYWKRVFRILPALLLVLGITYLLGYTSVTTIVLALLFVQCFDHLLHLQTTGPFWSLSIEEQFYFLWPAVVRKLSARRMHLLLVLICIAEPLLRFASVATGHGRTHYTFVNCDGLAWGAMLALQAARLRLPYRDTHGQALWRRFGLPLLTVGAVVVVVSEALRAKDVEAYQMVISGTVWMFTGILCWCITHGKHWASRLLSVRPLRFLGDISYMLYLSHLYVISLFDDTIMPHLNLPPGSYLYVRFLFTLTIMLALCTLSLRYFERPVGALRRYFLRDRHGTVPALRPAPARQSQEVAPLAISATQV